MYHICPPSAKPNWPRKRSISGTCPRRHGAAPAAACGCRRQRHRWRESALQRPRLARPHRSWQSRRPPGPLFWPSKANSGSRAASDRPHPPPDFPTPHLGLETARESLALDRLGDRRASAVTQTPRPGNFRRISGTTAPSGAADETQQFSGRALRPCDDAGALGSDVQLSSGGSKLRSPSTSFQPSRMSRAKTSPIIPPCGASAPSASAGAAQGSPPTRFDPARLDAGAS